MKVSMTRNEEAVAAADCTPLFRHPLEIIPIFRRVPPSVPRDVIYTIVWNSLFALFFTTLAVLLDPSTSVAATLRITFVFAQCIGFVIYAAFVVTEKLFGPAIHRARFWIRSAYFALVSILAIFPGYLIAFRILNWKGGPEWLFSVRAATSIILVTLTLTGVLLLIFVPRERAARAEAAIAREQARVAAAENDATTARMKLLEAQVEPHFLYNTLAHVVSLVDREPSLAKGMIERLIVLLRASARAAPRTTLGTQLDLLRAYLEIIALRMGSRLAWRIDVPATLYDVTLPPMLLQPIVENAVRHGLEPALEGGEIVVSANHDAENLVLSVRDTGLGFRTTGSPGMGLSNLRARLDAAYGDHARMAIEDAHPRGTRVTLTLPLAADTGSARVAEAVAW
jgi:signal transduction histidine kinase